MSILNDISQRSYIFRDWPGIATDATTSRRGEEWAANRDVRLSPESIAKVGSHNHAPSDPVVTTLFIVVPLPC
jgi:hypothetical protein